MVDMAAIGSALTAFKGMKDIAEAMIGIRDAQVLQEKRLEFQSRLIDAQNSVMAVQEERSTLVEEITQLKEKIAAMENWNAEKERYHLSDIGQSVVAFVEKDAVDPRKASHKLCANCFEQRQKSFLILIPLYNGRSEVAVCNRCGAIGYTQGVAMAEHATVLSRIRK
jgi:hypothetical protein